MTALLSLSGCALPLGACRIVAGKKERRRRRSSAVTRGFPLVLIHHAVGVNLSHDEDEHNKNHPQEEDDAQVDAPQEEQWILCRTSASLIDDEEPQQGEKEETSCMLELCFSSSITLKRFNKNGVGGGGKPSSSLLEHLWTATTTRSSDGVNPRHARTYRTRECPCNRCTRNSNRSNKALQLPPPSSCHLYIVDDSDDTTAAGNVSASEPNTITFFAPVNSPPVVPAVSVILTYTSAATACSNHVEDDEDEPSSAAAAAEVLLLERQPLLQSCIKRQLVGCPVVFYKSDDDDCAGVTSEIRLTAAGANRRLWTLTVQSMSVATSSTSIGGDRSSTGAAVALILPSTRITLLHRQPPKQQQQTGDKQKPLISKNQSDNPSAQNCAEGAVPCDDNNRPSISPAARILVDTIYCMRRIHCCQSPPLSNSCDVPRTFLFTGPPGTGKSHAVRLAVQEAGGGDACSGMRCHLVVLQGSEILAEAGHPAEAARSLERQFQKAAVQTTTAALTHRGPDDDDDDERNNKYSTVPVAVIFLDECDALLSSASSSSSPDGSSSVSVVEAVLGRLLDRLHADPAWRLIMVVAATNRIDSIPSSLRRPGRFDREIPLAPPDAVTRRSILESLLQEQYGGRVLGYHARDQLGEIADLCVGYVPADLAALVRRAELLRITQQHTLDSDDLALEPTTTIVDLLRRAMADVGASALRDAALKAPPTTTFDDIAGDPGGAKTALRQAIEWPRTKSAAYRALGLTPPRGILLHGPPGCAKTTLARAAAGASAVAFVSLSPADVYSSSYVGDAEAVVRRAFALARSAAPCILFFDEIDAILGCSDGDGSGSSSSHGMGRGSSNSAEARVLSTYLNEMEGVDGSREDGVLVLGATNRPWTLDAALLRPGRFDKVIYVPPPDYEGRRSILTMQCQHWNTVHGSNIITGVDIDQLASDAVTGNMTGAEIVGACREAAMLSFRDAAAESRSPVMKMDYLRTALDAVQPLLSNPTVMNEFQSFEDRRRRLTR